MFQDHLFSFLALILLIGLVIGAIWLAWFKFNECLMIGHTLLYCILFL